MLKWEEVDLAADELRLGDGKTKALTPEAVRVLEAISRCADDPWVIGGKRPGTHMRKLDEAHLRLRVGLEGVRIHDLRHSYTSRALVLGESLPMSARLLEHREIETAAPDTRSGDAGRREHRGGYSVGPIGKRV